ncbi:MAG: septum formation family protein [Mycobacterium sp.]|nr:septum formation family protein [Mycobacterium sp.]
MISPPVVPDHQADDVDTALVDLLPADQPAIGRSRGSRRILLAMLLCAVLVGGVVAVANGSSTSGPVADTDHVDSVFHSAHSGSCLAWQPDTSPRPSFVQCSKPHLFEVVNVVDGDGDQEACAVSVRRYLGPRYDPNSRFTASLLKQTGPENSGASSRKSLCGLQLAGLHNQPLPFRGLVAEQDQSRVWPPGTCLPDPAGAIPIECAEPHAVEVVGPVDLSEHFHEGPPSDAEQEPVLLAACTTMAAAYLAPKTLRTTDLTLHYRPISGVSWSAGSRQTLCALAARSPGQLTGSAKSYQGAPAPAAPVSEPPHPWVPSPTMTTTSEATTAPSVAPSTAASTAAPEPQTSSSAQSSSVQSSASQTAGAPSTSATETNTPPQNPPAPPADPASPADAQPSNVVQVPGLPDVTLPFLPPPA